MHILNKVKGRSPQSRPKQSNDNGNLKISGKKIDLHDQLGLGLL